MNGEYARHKKFIMDVLRAVDVNKISDIVSYYLPLRASSVLEDLDDEKILNAVKMITNTELNEVYPALYKSGKLTDHEIIFRIKRVKYVKAINESMDFVPTPTITELGKSIGTNNIKHLDIENIKIVRINEEKKRKIDENAVLDYALKNIKWKGRDGHVNKGIISPEKAVKELSEKGIKVSASNIRCILRNYYKDQPLN